MGTIAVESARRPLRLPGYLPDVGAVCFLVALTSWILLRRAVWHLLPLEDSLMLLRYSQHLAQGYGIRWNIHDAPLEGATDFLFMVTIAGIMKMTHLGAIFVCRLVIALSHLASVVLLYSGARWLFRWPVWASLCLAAYLVPSVALVQLSLGFGAPFCALFALGGWLVALAVLERGATAGRGVLMGVLMLLTALARPEGCFLALFVFAAVWMGARRASLRALVPAVAVFAVLGGTYFVARWHYFGFLLPNPFYLKGGGHLYPQSLTFSFRAIFAMALPVFPFLIFRLFSREWRRAVVAVLPLVGYMGIWVLLSNENNYGMRFQYPVIPLTLLSIPYLVERTRLNAASRFIRLPLAGQVAAVLCALISSRLYWYALGGDPLVTMGNGAYLISMSLQPFKDKGYVIATSEAGTIPYFSEWNAVDLYGLNDAEIVHKGLTEGYLERRDPAVIIYHQVGGGREHGGFQRLLDVSSAYAQDHHYILAAEWGSDPCDRHVWWVRPGLPETDAFLEIIRRKPHFYLATNLLANDYRGQPYPERCTDPGQPLGIGQ